MRILVNAVAAKMGGALWHLKALVRELERRQSPHDWVFMVDATLGEIPTGRVEIRGVRVGGPAKRVLMDELAFPLWVRRYRADVLVSLLNHGPRFAGVPHVVFQRNGWYFGMGSDSSLRLKVQRALALSTCKGAAAVVVPSRTMARSVEAALGPRPPVVVIPHGVDTDFFSPSRQHDADLPDASLLAAGHPRLVYVAHASRHKAHDDLIHAMRLVARAMPEATLALTLDGNEPTDGGDQERTRSLMAMAADMPGVRFVGRCSSAEVRALYGWADIAVFPSRLETFGFPLVEAMSMGVPIVASDLAVSRELAGEAAAYHPVGDAAQLAQRLVGVGRDEQLRAHLASEGAKRAPHFSMRRATDLLENVLEAVVRGDPIAAPGSSA